jgi:hypothetical protein
VHTLACNLLCLFASGSGALDTDVHFVGMRPEEAGTNCCECQRVVMSLRHNP